MAWIFNGKSNMKVLLWQIKNTKYPEWDSIVLWDGENTYWIDTMTASSGYKNLAKRFNKFCKVTNGRFILIGEL